MAAGHERGGNLDHALDVIRRAWEYVGRQDVDGALVTEELIRIAAGDVCRCETGTEGFGDDLVLAAIEQLLAHVTDVGDVLDVSDGVPQPE